MSQWDKRIAKAEKFMKNAVEHGRRVYARYQDDRSTEASFNLKRANIFYANVNTIKESLFNSLPKPEVSRLHKGDFEDDVARVAAMILQRALGYEVHCAESFEAAIKAAILDRLVPGIGQVWCRFEKPEAVYIDVLYWEEFIYSPARNWEAVWWVGRRHELTKEEFVERYGEEGFAQAQMIKDDNNVTPKEITADKYQVYEIWDKTKKKVYHICKGAEKPLKELDDPYQLLGFFPCPKPLIANVTTSAFLPVTDYHIAQDQYNELDILYARMALISKAVKVAGCYDASATGIGKMLEGQENMLVPVDNWAMYAERGGAKGMIDWYPVEQVVTVFQALQSQYESVKGVLYEITGMSDIMRGASNQYETAAAQQIKAQFASVRMNGYQRDVSYFVRDTLRIMADLMMRLYSDQKFIGIVGNFTQADMQYIPPAMQVLRSDTMRKYKVDIEADSLTQADWALEKNQRMELVGYMSQFLMAAVPAVKQTPELGALLLSMIKFSVAGFKGAAEIEGILDQQLEKMTQAAQQPPGPPQPSPEEMQAQAEGQKMQAQMQMEQQKAQQQMQLEQQKATNEAALKQRELDGKLALERIQAEADIATAQAEMEMKRELHAMDMQMKAAELEFKQQEMGLKIQSKVINEEIDEAAREANYGEET